MVMKTVKGFRVDVDICKTKNVWEIKRQIRHNFDEYKIL